MARLLGLLITLLSAACVATVIAEGVLVGYAVGTGKLDRQKMAAILAVVRGQELKTDKKDDKPAQRDPKAEQIAYEQVLEARAMKDRNLELREQALRNALDQMRFDQNQFTADRDDFLKLRQTFTEQLADVKKRATDDGWDEVRRTLSTIKPKQAKELLTAMLGRNEIKDVVSLLSPMPDAKRAKIIAEFKTPDEVKKIDEVLRLVRQGEPTVDPAAEAQQKLSRAAQPKAQGTP